MTWDRGGDPVGIAAVVHPGWVQRALTAEGWRGFPGNEPGGGEGFSKVERIAQQIFDKLAELHITYVHEPAESVPEAQRVRAVDEVLSLGQATCLDMCAAFCSAALDAGIYPLLLTVRQEEHRRHALVLVPLDLRWSFGVPTLLDEGFSRSPLIIDGDDVRDLVANAPDDAMGTWLAIDVEQATYLADRDAGDWACAIASGASYVKEWDWDVCVDVGGIRAQQDNSSELPTLARTEKVLAPGYLPLPDDSTPLQMIRTRYGVVPFCSRPEYRELREWAVGTAKSSGRRPDVSVAVLTGAGGVGKTRMAAQLCHDLEVLGWYTGFAPAKSAMKNDELTYLAELTTELLIVVDYAEESRQEQLVALLRALRGRRSPTRIVLTARGIDSWWEDFCEDLESDGTQLGQVLVKQLEPRPDPVLLYRQAVRGFSKVINGVNPPEVAIPEHAGDTALDIVLQAWLAVVDNGGMQDPQPERSVEKGARSARASNPNARDSLYDRVLRLEFKRWRAFPELQDISLKHLRRIAATLSLHAPDAGQVDDVLSRLPEWRGEHLRRSKFAELLSTTLLRYAGDGGVSLRPDPVAEHLILSVFGDEPEQLDAVLPGEPLEVPGISEPDASEATVTRAIMLRQQAQNLSQVITRAASQDQESATALAQHILKVCPHLWSSALEVALAQGGPFVDALENLIESGTELPFEEIEVSIPLGHSALRGVALAATQRMEAPSERDPVERAHYLHNLANRLSDVGCSGEALEVAQEAVALYRDLAQAYTPNLAASLGSLAYILADVGCSGEALEAAQEAVGLYRALVQGSPVAYTPGLALSLNNLANILSGVGRSGEAVEVAQEAVGLYQELVQGAPAVYTSDQAALLNNLANILSDMGRLDEALEVIQEAVRLRRALVQGSPAAYTSDLALSLVNLANILSGVGRSGEALEAAQEAVGLYRDLAEGRPAVYTSDLAMSLSNLVKFLSGVGCSGEALGVAQEAVGLYRDLVEGCPAVYTPGLALSLSNLANILSGVGCSGEALEVAQEAVGLYRDLQAASPGTYTSNLALSLSNLVKFLADVGCSGEALGVAQEAVGLYRALVQVSLAAYAPELARSLSNLAKFLSEVGCSGEALGVAQEAVGLYRDLVQVSLAAYAPELARSLNNLATSLSEVGRLGEALEAAQEAVGLYRGLVEGSPAAYTPDLAASLNNLACFLSDVGCGSEALEVIQEAVRLRRDLVEGSPAAYTPDLAMSLSNLASILSDVGRWGEALGAAQEAVDLCRDLVEGSPAAYTPDLAMSLSNLANVLSEEGRYEEAFNVFTEGFDRFSPTIRSRLLLARATWRDDDQDKDLKEAAREADQLDDPAYLGPTRRMVVQALTAAGCDDVDLPAWATATIDESVRSSINDWLLCSDLREQAAHLKSSWSSPSKSDRDALAVEVERYVDVPAIGRLLFLVDAVMVEGVDSVVAWLNSVDCAQNLAASWYSAHTSGRGASFVRSQLREQDEDSTSGTDQPGDIDEGSRTLSNPEIRSVVLEILEANLPEDGFTELRRTLDLAEVSNADIAYAVLASDEDAEDALKELLEVARWRAMLMVPGLRPGLEEKSVHGGVAVALHAAVSEHPDQARDLLRSAYRKADPGDRTLIEVLMSKASRADDCPQEIADLCAWFRKEGSPREETGNGSPTSPS